MFLTDKPTDHTVLDRTIHTAYGESKENPGKKMAAICGRSMARLFTLLGEIGCQHWTLSLPNTTVGNDKTPSVCSYGTMPHSCLYFAFNPSEKNK